MTPYDWNLFRSKFPALDGRCYLNTAGGGVMSTQVAEAAISYFRESVEEGDINWNRWIDRSESDRADVAAFVGAAKEAIAFLQNASLGLNIVARSLLPGSRVLAIRPEFPSCTTPFIRAGMEVSFIETAPSGFVDDTMVSKVLKSKRFDIFVLSSVQFANGFRASLESIGRVCRDLGVLFAVDATQSIGAFDINMTRDHIDALTFSGYKWATAGYGNAVLATGGAWPITVPPLVGWRSAKSAYELENDRLDLHHAGIGHEMGHPPFPGIFAMGEALRLLSEPPKGAISERIVGLSTYLRARLKELGIDSRSDPSSEHTSGIVLAEMKDASIIKNQLQERSVWVTARQGGLRISVHAYNSTADVDWLIQALGDLKRQPT